MAKFTQIATEGGAFIGGGFAGRLRRSLLT